MGGFVIFNGVAAPISSDEAWKLRLLARGDDRVPDGVGVVLKGCDHGWDCLDDLDITSFVWIPAGATFAVVDHIPAGMPTLTS